MKQLTPESRIYVAGHRGLVGSAILRQLQARGYQHLITRTHQELDLLDAVAVERFMREERPDYIFLAAAHVGGIMANQTYRADFIMNNLGIQQNVLTSALRNGVEGLLFLGSSCIYPRLAPQPMREDALLTSPLEYTNEPYAIAKIAGMKMCESMNLQYGTNYLSVMPTNLYGYGDNFDLVNSHVLPAMIRKLHLAGALLRGDLVALRWDVAQRPLEGLTEQSSLEEFTAELARYGITPTSLQLWGTGSALREFMWSDDLAEACITIAERVSFEELYPAGEQEIRNTHINIGSGEEVSIRTLATLVAEATHYEGSIEWDSTKPDGTPRKLLDLTRLTSLGYTATTPLAVGIPRLYDWYCQQSFVESKCRRPFS